MGAKEEKAGKHRRVMPTLSAIMNKEACLFWKNENVCSQRDKLHKVQALEALVGKLKEEKPPSSVKIIMQNLKLGSEGSIFDL